MEDNPASTPRQPLNAIVCRSVEKVFHEGETSVKALRGVDLDVQLGKLTFGQTDRKWTVRLVNSP